MTNPFKYVIITILLIVLVTGCNNQTREVEKVNKVIYQLIEADNHSNIKAVLNAYTDSVEFYPAGKSFTKGIDNVRKSYENLFRQNQLSITTEILATKVFENDAIVKGINRGTKKPLTDSSISKLNDKFIAILIRNAHGEWKIDKLIWSPAE